MRRPQFLATGLLTLLLNVTADAAHLVRDINAVPIDTGSPASGWTQLDRYTLFLMDDGLHGQELWRTTGTPGSTELVLDINPGPASADIYSLTVLNGVLYFISDDGTNGHELWRSDGTAAGTHIVADINRGAGDGTAAGTYQVANIPPLSPAGFSSQSLIVAGEPNLFYGS